MIPKKVQAVMNNYSLQNQSGEGKSNLWDSIRKFAPLLAPEKKQIILATVAAFVSSGLNLVAPVLIGRAVDRYIVKGSYHGVLVYSAVILAVYIGSLIANYFQTLLMGRVGQNVLFSLRNSIFEKLQSLPIAFFNQNKAGDLISRINNDTDKLNQFFSQSLVQFVANIVTILGASIFVLTLNWSLGIIAVGPALILLLITQFISPWIKKRNALNLKNVGGMSGEISESIDNFKVVAAFNRKDYFKARFSEVNETNYNSAIDAAIANNILTPFYGLASNAAQLSVIAVGLGMIVEGHMTLGLLISFISYVSRIYDPLRQIAQLWSSFQTAFASWDRIHSILELDTDLLVVPGGDASGSAVLEFKDVYFSYPNGKEVLHHINLTLEQGKTYALVGPTGGGKTTTASLMARLYDPTKGTVYLNGKDIRSYNTDARARKIGFILQEPFLFTGSVKENIIYGNPEYKNHTNKQLEDVLKYNGLSTLLARFEEGLETKLTATGSKLSLGQKQLIAFIRAVLRRPEILILDEATANIDTVTEKLLQDILEKLPKKTTLVVIAHRLNTIENADEIFFINNGEVTPAGSFKQAVDMLLNGKRES